MRKIILSFFLTCIFFQISIAQSNSYSKARLLRHVVMFKFADKASKTDIKKVEDAFRALPGKIALIKDFEWGTNNSPEKLNQGLTHCFFLSFTSEKDRDAYLVHPAHKVFVTIVGSNVEKVTVLDYWTNK